MKLQKWTPLLLCTKEDKTDWKAGDSVIVLPDKHGDLEYPHRLLHNFKPSDYKIGQVIDVTDAGIAVQLDKKEKQVTKWRLGQSIVHIGVL